MHMQLVGFELQEAVLSEYEALCEELAPAFGVVALVCGV
jgi:flagellar motor component MotA